MAEEGEPCSSPYRLSHYSIFDLLRLANTARAKKVLLEVGYTPLLFLKKQKFEIDGPDVTSEAMEELLHSVATTRQIRSLRIKGTIQILQTHKQHQILVQFVDAFGIYRMDLVPIATSWSKPQE